MRRLTLAVAATVVAATGLASSAGSENAAVGRIAFASDYPLPPTHHQQVLAAGVDGRGRRNLGGDTTFAYRGMLSPDRTRVAVVRSGPTSSEVWIVGVDGTDRRRLLAAPAGKSFGRVAWSPNGKVMALGLGNADYGFEEVWLVRVTASGGTPDARFRQGPYEGFLWSPSDDRLVLERLSYAGCGPGIFKWCATWHLDIVGVNGARLAGFDGARNAVWSPDGSRLAFELGDFTDIGEADAVVTIARADGTPVRTISSRWPPGSCSRSPRWSPDGRWVSYLLEVGCDSSRVVSVVVRAGSAWKDWRLPTAYAQWSPRGSRLLSVESIRGRSALFVSRADGRHRRLVATGVTEAGWSPTGAIVWLRTIHRHSVLFTASGAGRGTRQLTSTSADASLPAFAPGRGRCAVVVARPSSTRIYQGDLRSDGLRLVAREPAGSRVTLLGWSRNLRTVVYSAQDQRTRDFDIWTTGPDGSDVRRLTASVRNDRWPVWSPDGTRIAFVRDVREAEAPNDAILVTSADGRDERRLAVEYGGVNSSLAWSPDGTKVAYSAFGRAVVANADGSSTRGLTAGESPTWSADGHELAFVGRADGIPSLRVIRVDGTGERTLVPHVGGGAQPAWSPDGTVIAFNQGNALKVVRPDGTGERTLARNAAGSIRWSPDGTKLAFAGVCCGPEQGVFVVNADGSDLHRVGTHDSRPSWSSDGARLVFDGPGAPAGFYRRLFVVDADGTNLTAITTPAATSDGASWGPRP
jgi:Tol biopolymer transport system component